MSDEWDYLVVGSGLFGSVFAHCAAKSGKRVLVLERRGHIGGNCHSAIDEQTQILVHTYGTHVFHTSDSRVWGFINGFTRFNSYRHRSRTMFRGRAFPMPINLQAINDFFNVSLNPTQARAFIKSRQIPCANPVNLEEQALATIGRELYEAFIEGYTRKHWQCDPKLLPAGVFHRIPIRFNHDDSYFNDPHQGVPLDGYHPLFERLLKGIPIELHVDYLKDREHWRKKARRVLFTGPVDRYFEYAHGQLQWRSIRHEIERFDIPDHQGVAQMHFPDPAIPHTRVHEPAHLHPERPCSQTLILKEFPCIDPENPAYPVHSPQDQELFQQYLSLCNQESGVLFGGRLGHYRYYNMDQAIAAALALADKELN